MGIYSLSKSGNGSAVDACIISGSEQVAAGDASDRGSVSQVNNVSDPDRSLFR
ncbi:MAG: hypothetical protein U9Q68_03735 [Euryarchaeota archaeon]|nr:hypothetical protein [Euryarchaeota archaeon]